MVELIGEKTLRDSRTLAISVVTCPDDSLAEELSLFYCHKPEHWVWQIEQGLRKQLDELEMRGYLGRCEGELAGGICSYERRGVGVFSHVYTNPHWRGLGVASRLQEALLPNFAARGGRFLTLGTDPGGQAYRLYERAGFRPAAPGYGTMIWEAATGAYEAYFTPQQCHPVEVQWHHWPLLCALMATEAGGVFAKHWYNEPWIWFENDFLLIMQSVDRGETRMRVLEGEDGAALGYASLTQRWPGNDDWQLELYAYPGFWEQVGMLLESLNPIPPGTRCYADTSPERIALLQAAGFIEKERLDSRWGRNGEGAMVVLAR